MPQSVLDAIDDDETIDYREEVTKRLLGESIDVPKLAYESGCFSTLAEMYGTPADTPAGGQGRTGILRDFSNGSRPCVVYKKGSPAFQLRQELLLPKLELRRVVIAMGMDNMALDTLDARVAGCCHAGDDRQFDGIAQVKRRPRENAVIFGLDAYLVTISTMYSGSELDLKSTRIKLIGLAVGHLMQMFFYCNPLVFLSQCCKCTPYDDRAGVQSRGSLLKMGYPYNYEPLNFIRAAGSCICGMFAIFQTLAMEGKAARASCTGSYVSSAFDGDATCSNPACGAVGMVSSAGCGGGAVCVPAGAHDCETTFDTRVANLLDPKDSLTCPTGCVYLDDAMTPEEAMTLFLTAATGCLVFYSAWLMIRCCVFSKHRREARREELRQEMARKKADKADGKLKRKNVRSM